MRVNPIKITKDMKVSDLIKEMGSSGVLGAGRTYRATELLSKMFKDPDMKIFFSIAGPLVPGGMRGIVVDLIKEGHIDVLITSGANLTHDLLESFGGNHYRDYGFDDEKLHESGMGRIGDIYTRSDDFEIFEKEITLILGEIANKKNVSSIQKLLYEIGARIKDENSIIRNAHLKGVPIYAPGIIDSMLGLQLWMFTQTREFILDAVADMNHLSDIVFQSQKVGAVILGGGLPKHYTLASNLLKGGVDAALQITLDRSEGGSLSGAPLEEAKSWAKARAGSNLVSVIGDVTIIFPLILAGALDF
ncbi:MAG: deoxyhypusine synthase [Euryarchaeota archaeon]|nr:deoxyhypusine synthase [Euryarchaeota archaeon]MBU4608631.1 deoxyhypusine synthase [Euryarchaeota archaeon]MBV1730073.1 deoxyhypusine synthase [Methanobacterium sp.]MBV1754565.1 deoxyhypusine synthase [Methanobacterium sp.]